MQSLKWRLSFNSLKNNRQLKKLWIDFGVIWGGCDVDHQCAKIMVSFLDAFLSLDGDESIRSILAESDIESINVIQVLLSVVLEVNKKQLSNCANEEAILFNDLNAKALSACEVLSLVIVNKHSNTGEQDKEKSIIRLVLGAINEVENLSYCLTLLRILKTLLSLPTCLTEMKESSGLSVLTRVVDRLQQPAVVSQVLLTYRLFVKFFKNLRTEEQDEEFLFTTEVEPTSSARVRTLSNGSTSSTSVVSLNQTIHHSSGKFYNSSLQRAKVHSRLYADLYEADRRVSAASPPEVVETQSQSASIATAGINFALNVVSELLKFSPLAANWMNMDSDLKEKLNSNTHTSQAETLSLLAAFELPLATLQEESRNLELLTIAEDSKIPPEKYSAAASSSAGSQSEGVKSSKRNSNSDGEQDILSVLIWAVERAIGPTDAKEVLFALQSMLIDDRSHPQIGSKFAAHRGYSLVVQMLVRVESSLDLLVPCSQTSFAAAVGKPSTEKAPSGFSKDSPRLHSESSGSTGKKGRWGRYFSFAGAEFDKYYGAVLMLLLSIITGDPLLDAGQEITSSVLPGVGVEVKNTRSMALLVGLLTSERPPLIIVAVKICFALVRQNPGNAVVLEGTGVVTALLNVLVDVVLLGDVATIRSVVSLDRPGGEKVISSNGNSPEICRAIADAILVVLQLVSVATVQRDDSVFSTLIFLAFYSSVSPTGADLLSLIYDDTNFGDVSRCQNCELECAVWECLSDGCIDDRCSRLCGECDKVFHKAAAKRNHLRIRVLGPHHNVDHNAKHVDSSDEPPTDEVGEPFSEATKTVVASARALLSGVNKHCAAVLRRLPLLMYRESSIDTWRGTAQASLLAAIRGLLDDKRARGKRTLLAEVFPLLLTSLRFSVAEEIPEETHVDTDLGNLADTRVDLLLPERSGGDKVAQPPEVTQHHPRRVKLSLFIQILSRFLVYEADASVFNPVSQVPVDQHQMVVECLRDNQVLSFTRPADRIRLLEMLTVLEVDAVLVRCLAEKSPRTPLTLADRHFIVWLMRECVVLGMDVAPLVSRRLLQWLVRLLDGCRDSGSAAALRKTEKIRNSRAQMTSPVIQLVVLQELIVLLDGYGNYSNTALLPQQSVYCRSPHSTVLPIIGAVRPEPPSRSTSVEEERGQHRFHLHSASKSSRRRQRYTSFTSMFSSDRVKAVMVELGFLRLFQDIFTRVPGPATLLADVASSVNGCSETEKEIFWHALTGFCRLVSGCDAAKRSLAGAEVKQLGSFLLPLLQLAPLASSSSKISSAVQVDYANILRDFILELSVLGGRLIEPSSAFTVASNKYPMITTPNVLSKSNSDSRHPSSQGSPLGTNQRSGLDVLLTRQSLQLLSDVKALDNFFPGGHPSSLTPVYFVAKECADHCMWTLMPHPLSLTADLFVQEFEPSTNQNCLPGGALSRMNSGSLLSHGAGTSSPGHLPYNSSERLSCENVDTVKRTHMSGLQRRMFRRNVSTASVQSLESDRWELDSTGLTPSNLGEQVAGGRGSLSSFHSLLTLSQALGCQSQNHTPTPSVYGDASVVSSQLLSRTHTHGVESAFEHIQADVSLLQPFERSTSFVVEECVFPPMAVVDGVELPLVYFPLLREFDRGFDVQSTKLLVLLHHAVLIKAGLSVDLLKDELTEAPDADDGAADETEETVTVKIQEDTILPPRESHFEELSAPPISEGKQETEILTPRCMSALRRHLALLLLPRSADTGSESTWQPCFTFLTLHSIESVELLLALSLVLGGLSQSSILTYLSRLLDGNPANCFLLLNSASFCSTLCRVILCMEEGATQDSLGYVLSQVLRYSVHSNMLGEIVTLAGSVARERTDREEGFLRGGRSVLFVMGRAAEALKPASFLHFEKTLPFATGVEMKPLVSNLSKLDGAFYGELSVCGWIRPGSMGNSPVSVLLQLCGSGASDSLVTVFFRQINRFTAPSTSNIGSTAPSKRVLQLCASFGKQIRPRHGNTLVFPDLEARCVAEHWRGAVAQLMGVEGKRDCEAEVKGAVSVLAGSLLRVSLPDVLVEYEWIEDGDWHLLHLSLQGCDFRCSVDGVQQQVLRWRETGYQRSIDLKDLGKKTESLDQTASEPVDALKGGLLGHRPSVNDCCFDFSRDVTKEEPLRAIVGGLLYEKPGYELLKQEERALYNTYHKTVDLLSLTPSLDSVTPDKKEQDISNVSTLLHSFDSLVVGFSGSIGELALFDGPLNASQLQECLVTGPGTGIKELLTTRLSCLLSSAPSTTNSRAGSMSSDTGNSEWLPSLSFPPFRPTSPVHGQSVTKRDSGTSTKTETFLNRLSMSRQDPAAAGENKLGRDSRGGTSVQIHHTKSMAEVLQFMGGMGVLFPLMSSDKACLLASLRVIGCALTSSPEAVTAFHQTNVDKALLFCLRHYRHLVTLETIRAICDCVSHNNTHGSFGAVEELVQGERVLRPSLLQLLMEVVVSIPSDVQLARSAVNWLREICDEDPTEGSAVRNSQQVVNSGGLYPLLILLSVWSVREVSEIKLGVTHPTTSPSTTGNIPSTIVDAKSQQARSTSRRGSKQLDSLSAMLVDSEEKRSFQPISLSKDPTNGVVSPRLGAFGSPTEAAPTVALQVEVTDKFRLHQSCFRLLKQLICGAPGEIPASSVHSLHSTPTGFSFSQFPSLLAFAVYSARSKSGAEEPEEQPSKEMIRRAARLRASLLQQNSFTGIAVLKRVSLLDPAYWSLSSAMVILDILLDVSNSSSFSGSMVSALKISFPGYQLSQLVLDLMGAPCEEIQERAIRLLLLTFSTLDGKLDLKQVSTFEKMHGFQAMTLKLGSSGRCSDGVVEALLGLLFWDTRGGFVQRPPETEQDPGIGSPSLVSSPPFPHRTLVSPQPTPERIPSLSTGDTPLQFPVLPEIPAASGSPNGSLQALRSKLSVGTEKSGEDGSTEATVESTVGLTNTGGGLMSLFSWGNSGTPSRTNAEPPIPTIEPVSTQDVHTPVEPLRASQVVPISGDQKGKPRIKMVSTEVEVEEQDTVVKEQKIEQPEVAADALPVTSDINYTVSATETIVLPQAFEVLVRTLQLSHSPDLVAISYERISRSLERPRRGGGQHCGPERNTSTTKTPNSNEELCHRNAEVLFSQRDWLLCLCDSLLVYRRRQYQADEGDSTVLSGISQSEGESHSAGAPMGLRGLSRGLAVEVDDGSEDSNSVCEEGASVGNLKSETNSISVPSSSWNHRQLAQYTSPIFSLVRRLLVLDLKSKPSNTRNFNDLFRLSLPETNEIQELLLMDLLDFLQGFQFFLDGIDVAINVLRNFSVLLEQMLEKTELSVAVCTKVVMTLHALSYQCPAEVRPRIKETSLPEIRKQYVVHCLVDSSEEFYARAVALSEINSPLLEYLSSTSSKALSDRQIVLLILNLFVESLEDLEFLFGALDTESFSALLVGEAHAGNGGSLHNTSNSTVARMQVSIQIMQSLIQSIQNCVSHSQESRRCVNRLLLDLPGDTSGLTANCLIHAFRSEKRGEDRSVGSQSNIANNTGNQDAQKPSHSLWWGAWSSSATPTHGAANLTTATAAREGESEAVEVTVDIETGTVLHTTVRTKSTNSGKQTENPQERAAVSEEGGGAKFEPEDPTDGFSADVSNPQDPFDTKSFILWFFSAPQRQLQVELRARILKEVKPVLRHVDRMRERVSQRFLRHSRQMQERRTKEKLVSSKNAKDADFSARQGAEKGLSKFVKELKTWVGRLQDKVSLGKSVFQESLKNSSSVDSLEAVEDREQLMKELIVLRQSLSRICGRETTGSVRDLQEFFSVFNN